MKEEIGNNIRTNSDDEIDLKEVFASVGRLLKGMVTSVVLAVVAFRRYTIRYKWLLVVLVAGSVGLAFGYNRISKPTYVSSLLISCDYFDPVLVEASLGNLNRLSGSGANQLAELLGISSETAAEIGRFEFTPVTSEETLIDIELAKQELKNKNVSADFIATVIGNLEDRNAKSYSIEAYSSNPASFAELQAPLVKYLKNQSYVKKRIEITRNIQKAEIEKLENEIEKLDSLKFVLLNYIQKSGNNNREGSNNVVLNDPNLGNPIDIFREDQVLYKRKLAIEREVMLESDFELIEGFTSIHSPPGTSTQNRLLTAILWAVGLGYFLILAIEFNRYLSSVEKKRQQSTVE